MSSTPDILPFRAREHTLANGLRVIIVPTGFPNLVSLQIPVQTGSRNEVEPGKSGFAHFFEHMMFRGTERFSAAAYQEVITRAGAQQNAYTTDDYTNYHTTFAAEDLDTILMVEADRFMHLAYAEEDFRTESRAVLGEYNKNSANPIAKLVEVQRDAAFAVHPYKHTTMGFLRDIEEMPNQFAYSRLFFERWYRPEHTSIIVAGDLDPDVVLALVERHWAAWRPGSASPIEIPREPEPRAPVSAHVPWSSPTLPWLTVAFHGPAFSETEQEYAALDMLLDLHFGRTSDLYRRLVETEQIVDRFIPDAPSSADPSLATILARVKKLDDLPAVRDAILQTVAAARETPVTAARLAEAKSNARYAFARTLDNSESVAATLARFVRFRRSYDTLNALYRLYDALTPDDLLAAARRYLRDERLVLTTLSHEPLPAAMSATLAIPAPAQPAAAEELPRIVQRSPSPLIYLKLQFAAGSAHDPAGKEGLAALSAAMVARAGSKELRYDEITRALFPIAGSFDARVDREVTTFTGAVHRDNLDRFVDIVLPQLLDPGLRETDFARLTSIQRNALVQDLRANNDEELGKERLQASVFAGTPYGHPTLGAVSAIDSLTLDDVRGFMARAYTRAGLTLGVSGDLPIDFVERLERRLSTLPAGPRLEPPSVTGRHLSGLTVEIVAKDTRSTALSLGHPITVTRVHPDFVALWLARSWLGEHRASQGRLFQRLREARGLNYGDYAYIEAFPGAMYTMTLQPGVPRRAQLFEIWIRPVEPPHAVFALKAALFELGHLIERGVPEEEFETTRHSLMKSVFVITKTQAQQLGHALDSRWYGTPEFTASIRDGLASLTPARVHEAIRRHLSARALHAVFVTRDADALRDELLSGALTPITYDAAKPAELLAEDQEIGRVTLGLNADRVRIVPVEHVFD